jgi:hypothetical protein
MSTTSRKYLPHDYQPSMFDIICGRGPDCFNHPGNAAFRQVIEKYLDRYGASKTKFEKTEIVLDVTNEVLHSGGSLCRVVRWCRIRKLWFELPSIIFRQKVGQTMRDALVMRDPRKRAVKKEKRSFQRLCREYKASQSVTLFGFHENSNHIDGTVGMMNPMDRRNFESDHGDHSERVNEAMSQAQPFFILPSRFNTLNMGDDAQKTRFTKNSHCNLRSNTNVEDSSITPNVSEETSISKNSDMMGKGEIRDHDDELDICIADWFDNDIFSDA